MGNTAMNRPRLATVPNIVAFALLLVAPTTLRANPRFDFSQAGHPDTLSGWRTHNKGSHSPHCTA